MLNQVETYPHSLTLCTFPSYPPQNQNRMAGRTTRANPESSNAPPPPNPDMAQLMRLFMEERQAAREERQANMAALQLLVQAAQNNRGSQDAGGQGEPRSRLRDFQNTNPPMFAQTKEPLDAEDWL